MRKILGIAKDKRVSRKKITIDDLSDSAQEFLADFFPVKVIAKNKKGQPAHFITRYIRERLVENYNEEKVIGAQFFFNEGVRSYGVQKERVKKFVMEAVAVYPQVVDFNTFFIIAEELFQSRMYEECQAAIIMLGKCTKSFDQDTLNTFTRWIDHYVENWAVCDSLCLKLISPLFTNCPELIVQLSKWTVSQNRWKRRAACVVLSKLCRKGQFVEEALNLAELLISDDDEMVQKGVGWLLKEVSRTKACEVIDFLNRHRVKIPQLVLNYAMERMNPGEKKEIFPGKIVKYNN